ncbi:hypothetical protein BG006_002751 [Podila minutissima]|uniref:F-box domain-containing protein n=1 Tax=Podila minutissima TaxID=64525 RepID=A0A9P5VGK8_9FUNG|nr:hypothetical protein BG006_002751 [Podila minutissima]
MTLVHTDQHHQWPPHPLLIPELRDPITETLTFRDFVACARVSRLWYHVFTPYVWHTLSGSKRFPDDFSRQGRHVRALAEVHTAQADILLDRMRENCLYLESVQLTWHGFYEDQFEMFFLGIKPEIRCSGGRPAPVVRPKPANLRQPKAGSGTEAGTTTTTTSLKEALALPNSRSEGSSSNLEIGTTSSPSPPEQIQQQRTRRAPMEKDLVRTKLSPEAFSIVARAAGRAIPKTEPKRVPIGRPRTKDEDDDSHLNDSKHRSEDTSVVQGSSPTNNVRLPDLPGTIPDTPNAFLSNTLHTLVLQVHHETILAILLWLTRAGLQGRLQGLRQFEISAHESMSIMTSKGKRYVPVSTSISSANQIHAGVLHDFWAVFPGLEICAVQAQITDDQTEIPSRSVSLLTQGSGPTTIASGANSYRAMATHEAYQIKRGHIARCGRHPGYLSEVVSTLAVIHRLTTKDPSLGISGVTQLQLKDCISTSSFSTLLSRVPHLTHLTVQRLESPGQLEALPSLCPKLSHFSFMGPPPERGATIVIGFQWGKFFKAMASTLESLVLKNVLVDDQGLRVLSLACSRTLRILSFTPGNVTGCSWKGAKAVLENCRVLESCTLNCYGPVDGLFLPDAELSALLLEEEGVPQQEEVGGNNTWACRDTLHTLCLYGLILYNAESNHKLFERLSSLRRIRALTITGRGLSLEALLGPQSLGGDAVLPGSSTSSSSSSSPEELEVPSPAQSLHPYLESIDLPRLTKRLTPEDLLALLRALPRLRWMDVGGGYEVDTLIWLETERRDLLTTFLR